MNRVPSSNDPARNPSDLLPRLRRVSVLVLVLLIAAALSTGCDSGTQEPEAPRPEPTQPSTPDPVDETPEPEPIVQRETPSDGSIAADRFPTELQEGITREIPDNFPSTIPIYPGAQPAQGRGADVDGSARSGVQLLSNDDPATIHGFYEAELKSQGWEIDESKADSMSGSIMATQGDCKASMLVLPSPKGGSDIFIVSQC